MTEEELKMRTKQFALDVFRLMQKLPTLNGTRDISTQAIRSGASVAANYRATCRAKSKKDFIYKLKVVLEEADETEFWMEFISDLNIHPDKEAVTTARKEANELSAIFSASIRTSERRTPQS